MVSILAIERKEDLANIWQGRLIPIGYTHKLYVQHSSFHLSVLEINDRHSTPESVDDVRMDRERGKDVSATVAGILESSTSNAQGRLKAADIVVFF